MRLAFDHLILLTHDLEDAVRDFEMLGFTVQRRNDSVEGSMRNRFICFADGSYLLLSTFADPDQAQRHRLAPFFAKGEGWADYSFVVDDLAGAASRLTSADLPTRGPVKVADTLATGEDWSLDLLMAGVGSGGDGALPFLVEDTAGRNKRIPAALPHANGATGIAGLRIAAQSAHKVVAAFETIAGRPLAQHMTETQGHPTTRLEFDGIWLEIVEDTALNRGLSGLYEAVLTTNRADAGLSSDLLHGASMVFA